MPRSGHATVFAFVVPLLASACATTVASGAEAEADKIRFTERARLAALVAGDLAAAAAFHAEDFQLVNPAGRALDKREYLNALSSGELDYVLWEPGDIAVRRRGDLAVIRYRSEIQVTFRGVARPKTPHWHTDLYEKRGGTWQIVWSQATEFR